MSMWYDVNLDGEQIMYCGQDATMNELYDFLFTKFGEVNYGAVDVSAVEFAKYLADNNEAVIEDGRVEFAVESNLYYEDYLHFDIEGKSAEDILKDYEEAKILFRRPINETSVLHIEIS
ncbi:MAG: hypothetical protein K2P14_10760 [Anaeroplasmataceae bacterium]|nr:hypothetical protein [Anaeroplasmataceae bacterium]